MLSPYDIDFLVPVQKEVLCEKTLTPTDIKGFLKAVDEEYYFELFVDGMPAWGYVGDSDKEAELVMNQGNLIPDISKYIYKHLHFAISYNGDSIVAVNVTGDSRDMLDITTSPFLEPEPLENVEFSYSVSWHKSNIEYSERMHRYQELHFLPASSEIHWLSIINAFVLDILLTAFLAIILMRVLKNDFSRYMRVDEEEEFFSEEESGWKLIHGDVFRFPKRKLLFAAMLGTGVQLFVMALIFILLAAVSIFSKHRGSMATGAIILYALTSGIGGYVSAKMYSRWGVPTGCGTRR